MYQVADHRPQIGQLLKMAHLRSGLAFVQKLRTREKKQRDKGQEQGQRDADTDLQIIYLQDSANPN